MDRTSELSEVFLGRVDCSDCIRSQSACPGKTYAGVICSGSACSFLLRPKNQLGITDAALSCGTSELRTRPDRTSVLTIGFPRRSVFVIDAGGVVRYAHRAIAGLTYRPVSELVEVLASLQ